MGDAAINAEDFQVTSSSESVAVESVSKNAQSDYILDVRLKSKVYLDNVVKLTYNGTSVKDNKDNALTTFSNLSVNNYAEERKTIPGKCGDFFLAIPALSAKKNPAENRHHVVPFQRLPALRTITVFFGEKRAFGNAVNANVQKTADRKPEKCGKYRE